MKKNIAIFIAQRDIGINELSKYTAKTLCWGEIKGIDDTHIRAADLAVTSMNVLI